MIRDENQPGKITGLREKGPSSAPVQKMSPSVSSCFRMLAPVDGNKGLETGQLYKELAPRTRLFNRGPDIQDFSGPTSNETSALEQMSMFCPQMRSLSRAGPEGVCTRMLESRSITVCSRAMDWFSDNFLIREG